MSHGFIDLRTNGHGDASHGGFWPSFTDIMMVVVMIFMLASVVLILRNWELVEALRATMESERLAEEMARSASETNATLEEQLAQAQHQLSELRMQRMQLTEEGERQRIALVEREQQLGTLRLELQGREEAWQRELRQRQSAEEQIALLREQNSQQEQRIASLSGEIAALEQSNSRQGEELGRLRQNTTQQTQQLTFLQQEYDTLKVKYDKLVKPARTAKGKHVVEVRYERLQGLPVISLRDSGEAELKRLSEEAMHARLAALKQANPNRLYIKIIIPADSGLSYSEAWSFMKEVLEQYDYYYQE